MVFTIQPVTLDDVRPLRDQILRAGLPAPGGEYRGDRNADTLHLGAFSSGKLIAVSTILRQAPDDVSNAHAWRLRGMAVDAAWRGHGVGAALATKCIEHAIAAAGHMVWCTARESAFDFYRRLGFELAGELFSRPEIVGERYARMEKPLPR
jgi:ribosomal protein S18 acetylase RimI-like enzyme